MRKPRMKPRGQIELAGVVGTVEWSSEDKLCWLTDEEFVAQTLTPRGPQKVLHWGRILEIDFRNGWVSQCDDSDPSSDEDNEFRWEPLTNILRWSDGQYVRICSDDFGTYLEFRIEVVVRCWVKCMWRLVRTVKTIHWACPDEKIVGLVKDRLATVILRERQRHLKRLLIVRQEKRESAEWLARRQYMAQFSKRARSVYQDSRKVDRRYGRSHALSLETIDKLLKKPCTYCGIDPDKVLMTLDRIDITLGHTDENVNPSCYECNVTRADMPYEAWIKYVAPGMREARKAGLLDGWKRTNKRNKNKKRFAEPKERPQKPEGSFRLIQTSTS